MANIPISVGGSWKQLMIEEKGKGGPTLLNVDGTGKAVQITVTTDLDNRKASFTLPLGASWEITIEEST